MVDLKNQFLKIEDEIIHSLRQVLLSSAFINGDPVQDFIEKLKVYLNCNNVIPCGNGTDALQLALMSLDIDRNKEVIIPSFTYVATAEVVALLGLKPVFVDVSPKTFTLDISKSLEAVTKNTTAIIPVNLYGQCCDLESLQNQLPSHIHIIEDNAQAIGADYIFSNGNRTKAGTIGIFGTTSFFPSKNLGAYGDGGAVYTNDQELGELCRKIANHGQSQKYIHDLVGINSRLDTMQAAILSVKLKYLDKYIEARQHVAARYDESLAEIEEIVIPTRAPYSTHVFHQYTIKMDKTKRERLKDHLNQKGIPSVVYYPVPLHLQKAFLGISNVMDCSNSEVLSGSVLSLPIHTEMEEKTQDYIIETISNFFKN